jgi:PhzF family phenazine biosynthesis protein
VAEVDLCGHATLASAFVIFNHLDQSIKQVTFKSRSGKLGVTLEGDCLSMDFPSQPPRTCEAPPALLEALGEKPVETLRSEDYFIVFPDEDVIRALSPDMTKLEQVDLRGTIVTARGKDVDFVSRFFAPKLGVEEDPVTGSAHCALIPYWSKQLDKKELHALQVSQRGGELFCRDLGKRVAIAGRAVAYMRGVVTI